MSSNYSRQNKSTTKKLPKPAKHLKTGLTAFQKTLAFIGSILSIVVASITISRALHPESNQKSKDPTPQSTSTIIKIIEKDSSATKTSETLTDNSSPSSSIPTQSSSSTVPTTVSSSLPEKTDSNQESSKTSPSSSTPTP